MPFATARSLRERHHPTAGLVGLRGIMILRGTICLDARGLPRIAWEVEFVTPRGDPSMRPFILLTNAAIAALWLVSMIVTRYWGYEGGA